MKSIVISVIGNGGSKHPSERGRDLTLIPPRDFQLLQEGKLAIGLVTNQIELEEAVTGAMSFLEDKGSKHVFVAVEPSLANALRLTLRRALKKKKVRLQYLNHRGPHLQMDMYVTTKEVLELYMGTSEPDDVELTFEVNVAIVQTCRVLYGHMLPIGDDVIVMASA